MRLRSLVCAAAFLCASLSARADDFAFTLDGGVAGFISGTGTLSATATGTNGGYLVTGITGTDVTGLIPVNGYTFTDFANVVRTNDNLFFPADATKVDNSGIGFYAQNASGTYDVSLYSIGTQYFAAVTETNTTGAFKVNVPVTFTLNSAATPEPSSLALLGTGALGLFGVARRRFAR